MKYLLVLFFSLVLCNSAHGQAVNTTLNGLANNTALDLGLISCTTVTNVNCFQWPTYSRIIYDRVGHRMLGWGGGHSGTAYDSVQALDLSDTSKLQWTELYAPTPLSSMNSGNWDSTNGSWKAGPSGPYPRPVATHSVGGLTHDPVSNSLITINIKDQNTDGGFPTTFTAGKYAHYSLAGNTWTFSTYGPTFPTPSDEGTECSYDPIGKQIVCIQSNNATIFTYDPATKVKTTRRDGDAVQIVFNEAGTYIGNGEVGYNNTMIYNPHDQNFYLFARGSPVQVFRMTINRQTWSSSIITRLTTTGAPTNTQSTGYGYDLVNGVFGTFASGQFRYFNWRTKVWASQTVTGATGTMLTDSMAAEYDPINNVFIFINPSFHTIAYKYINSTTGADFAKRCTRKGVIRCEGFDDTRSITGTQYVDPWYYVLAADGVGGGAASTFTIDTTIKSSGAGSARLNVPFGSPPCDATIGCWGNADIAYNFANDFSFIQRENTTTYLMYRLYMGPGFTAGYLNGHGGFKLSILAAASTAPGIGNSFNSCEDLSFVLQSIPDWGFFETYNNCAGGAPGFHHQEFINGNDYKLQNVRPSPFCLYTQTLTHNAAQFPPNGNCFLYHEQEWMSFKMMITTGPRDTTPGNNAQGYPFSGYWLNSRIKVWAAYDGQDWLPINDWIFGVSGTHNDGGYNGAGGPGSPNLWAGTVAENQGYGVIWLGFRNASNWASAVFGNYDELIVSTEDIAAPGIAGGDTGGGGPPPTNPATFRISETDDGATLAKAPQ